MSLPLDRQARWGLGSVVLAFAVGFVVGNLFAVVAVAAGAGATDSVTNTVAFIGEWIGFAGGPLFLSRTRGSGRMGEDFGFRFGGPADIGIGLAAGAAIFGAVAVYSAVLSQFDHANLGHEAQQLSGHGLGAGFVAFAVSAAIGAPFAEELFFRGLTQPVLQRHLGGWGGLAVTALVFGLVHLGGNPAEAIPPLAFFGAVVGWLAWKTGRLGPGIVAHMTFNGITVVQLAVSR